MLCGISTSFEMLFPARGQITHVFSPVCRFTRGLLPFLARLACVRHAASVRSEPGSNSPVELENADVPSARPHQFATAHANLVQHDTKSRCSSLTTLGPVPHIWMRERGRYYLVFKDRAAWGRPVLIGRPHLTV